MACKKSTKMSPPAATAAAAAAAAAASSSDWKSKRVNGLEADLSAANGKVAQLSFENAQQLLTLSRIYNVVTMDVSQQKSLLLIKSIIESTNIPGLSAPLPLSPPISSPKSLFSATTGPGSISSGTEDSDESGPTDYRGSLCGAMDDGHLKAGDEFKMSMETDPPASDDKDDAADEEFSLEEELAGIADAPAKNRAAMRATLREEQNARKKTLQQSAEEKRKTAEREGQQLKNAIPIPRPLPFRISQNTPRFVRPAKAKVNTEARAQAPAPKKPVTRVQVPTPEKPEAPARTHVNEEDDTDDDDETTPDMLGVVASSPKATDRFGVIFDPSNLDATTAARISGKTGSMDARRSVLIEKIPSEFTVHKLLAYVRGGTIVAVRLVPDSFSGQGQTALITFKTAQEAERCCGLTREIFSNSSDENFQASDIRISRLPTATYPTQQAVPLQGNGSLGFSNQQEPTRCIAIDYFSRKYVHRLCIELSLGIRQYPTRVHALEEMWFEGNTLHMSFTSISEAEKAYRIISYFYFRKFADQLYYCADPCAAAPCAAGDAHEVASSGCMGLKSLLETVGLAAYSKNQADEDVPPQKKETQPKANTPPMPVSAVYTSSNQTCQSSLLLQEIFGNSGLQIEPVRIPAPTPVPDTCASTSGSMPWTADLMQGLELL